MLVFFWLISFVTIVNSFKEIISYKSVLDASNDLKVDTVSPRIYKDINRNFHHEAKSKLKIVELGDWVLELDEGNNILSPIRSEWVVNDKINYDHVNDCNYLSGHVKNYPSFAAVTICGRDVRGFFRVYDEIYFVEKINHRHVLRKKSLRFAREATSKSLRREWEFFNLTGDIIDIKGKGSSSNKTESENNEVNVGEASTDLHSGSLDWNRERIDPEVVGYFIDTAWKPFFDKKYSRKKNKYNNQKRWLEIAIAVDYTVINFHGKKEVQQYILSLMNIVNAIYQDPSLDANLQLVITRLLFYEQKRHSIIKAGNAKKSLEHVNMWNKKLHDSLDPGKTPHDIAVWLTRADIGGPSGYAPVSGVCDPERSCALNRDEGLTSAFIIAHEMAHILGLSHDGDKKASNNCAEEALHGSVMAPMVSASFNDFLWSNCSNQEFKKVASKWKCLQNKPSSLNSIVLNSTLHNTFSMDEQCRMEFGEGYELCRAFDIFEPCSYLWCGHIKSPLVCKTKKGPPIEGTECGFNKRCVNGYCESVDSRKFIGEPLQHNSQDGEWGEWSVWGPCSRTCGTGVQFRVRKCNNPEPRYGGSNCFGSKEEWRICSRIDCPQPLTDIRAQQCKKLPKMLDLNPPLTNMTWLPYESEKTELKCKLICISKETKEIYVSGENVIDGTPCSYDNITNICIQGFCQILGCDRKLFSEKREDACGDCGGNNSNCTKMEFKTKQNIKKDINRVVVLPRFSREIKIEVNFSLEGKRNEPLPGFILKDRRRNSYSITIPHNGVASQILEGTKFYYSKLNTTQLLWAKGPLLSEIVVSIYLSNRQLKDGLDISLTSEYWIHKDMISSSAQYEWIVGGWGPCSKTCGGGKRFKTRACWDAFNSKIVSRKYCSVSSRPPTQSENCNVFSCNFQWWPGQWEPCSSTCGSYGFQSREMYCIPLLTINNTEESITNALFKNPWLFMVSPNKCGFNDLPHVRPCNSRPCPSDWDYGEWSQCSSSCGQGISVRNAYCRAPKNETFYNCNDEIPNQRRFCKGHINRLNNVLCKVKKVCLWDYSKFCTLPILDHYCKISGFRKFCCKTCAQHRLLPILQ